ncbi:Rid family detoxifying hydrolase [Basilea psittacipulmonis]|uniref:Endoribonuclease n=1 Tax=Basilea psittacipulmonis DSM 24701 TaxID=1072685 RepID=A0A077DCV3_9BURK|nr:Rid family detoxifying hydrolase [Basilea psittacipulmonis]AIL32710.1 endoribonuclease [Basilea psittacipulmonis DSM 24701]
MMKEIIATSQAPAALGPYSQAVVAPAGKTIYLSGQIGLNPETGELVSEVFEDQVKQAFSNMKAVIEAAGGRFEHIVKLTLFLTDLKNFATVNQIMSDLIPAPYPARSCVQASALPKNAQFEVEAIIVV